MFAVDPHQCQRLVVVLGDLLALGSGTIAITLISLG